MKAKIERIGYAKIIKAADQYLETKKATNVINSLSPKPIKINNYGVYIKLDGFFVQEDGIFIPKKDNEKTYSKLQILLIQNYQKDFTGIMQRVDNQKRYNPRINLIASICSTPYCCRLT
jgi:hypothetical protein